MRRREDVTQKKEIATRLREIRKSSGLTQEMFAEILELSLSAYKKIESAENQISIDSLRKIEEKLKVSSDYVLFGKREDVDEVWKTILNCSECDKMVTLFRLLNYFTAVEGTRYVTQEEQSIYDERFLKLLKEMDI